MTVNITVISCHVTEKIREEKNREEKKREENSFFLNAREDKASTHGKKEHPSLEEIEEYFSSIGMKEPHAEAQRFFAYNNATGWKVGKRKVGDWHLIADLWTPSSSSTSTTPSTDHVDVIQSDKDIPF